VGSGGARLFLVGVAPGPLPHRRRRLLHPSTRALPLPPPPGRRLGAASQVPSPRAQQSATATPVLTLNQHMLLLAL
jgi:hypothetical protein